MFNELKREYRTRDNKEILIDRIVYLLVDKMPLPTDPDWSIINHQGSVESSRQEKLAREALTEILRRVFPYTFGKGTECGENELTRNASAVVDVLNQTGAVQAIFAHALVIYREKITAYNARLHEMTTGEARGILRRIRRKLKNRGIVIEE